MTGFTPVLVASVCAHQPRICVACREKGEGAVDFAASAIKPYFAKTSAFLSPYVAVVREVVTPYVEKAWEVSANEYESVSNKTCIFVTPKVIAAKDGLVNLKKSIDLYIPGKVSVMIPWKRP